MPQALTYRVLGYEALLRAGDLAGRDVKGETRESFRETGRMVQTTGARKFARYSPKTAGGFRTVVRLRGVSVEQALRKTTGLRSDWGALQMTRALLPALEENEPNVEREFERAMDKVAAAFERRAA